MIEDTLRRCSAYRAACKFSGVFLAVVILLVGALGRMEVVNLLWAAAPLLFLGFMEAGYASQENRYRELLREGKSEKAALLSEPAGACILRAVRSVGMLSLWPFYICLLGTVFAGSQVLPRPAVVTPVRSIAGPSTVHLPPAPYRQPMSGPMGQATPPRPLQGQSPSSRGALRPPMTPPPYDVPPAPAAALQQRPPGAGNASPPRPPPAAPVAPVTPAKTEAGPK